MPIIFILFLVFLGWFHFQKSKATRVQKESEAAFWETERNANLTRKQDISNLTYVTIEPSLLPDITFADDLSKQYYQTLTSLNGKKILNLSHMTNTELKANYGIVNFAFLQECENNFFSFVQTLNDWGAHLIELNNLSSAKQVLSIAVQVNSDIPQSYVSLAKIYLIHNEDTNLESLLTTLRQRDDENAHRILSLVEREKYSYYRNI